MTLTAGVLAVQGDVSEHSKALENAGRSIGVPIEIESIRRSGIVPHCDFLSIPGGESTTISRLLRRESIAPEIRAFAAAEKPILATCAGLIVLSRESTDGRVEPLGCIDAVVERNAFGRQRESFEAAIDIHGLSDPFPAVFIRAPVIESVGESVDVLSVLDSRVVAVRDGPVWGTAFHPELTNDYRIHRLALSSAIPE